MVFESATAVTRLLSALARGPRDLRALGGVSVCAIGPSTADRLIAGGIKPDVVVRRVSASRASATRSRARAPLDGQRILVVRPDHLRDVARRGSGAPRRDRSPTSSRTARRAASPDSPAARISIALLLDGQIDAVTFTSPTAVRRFAVAHRRRTGRRPAEHDRRRRDRSRHGRRGARARHPDPTVVRRHLHGPGLVRPWSSTSRE